MEHFIKIFQQEKDDGLELAIASNKALGSVIKPFRVEEISKKDSIEIKPELSLASCSEDSSIYLTEGILVSTGWNDNDDVFTPEYLWAARKTAINKWFNYEHDDSNIIGVIVDCKAVDLQNNLLPDDLELDDLPDDFSLAVKSIIYRKWHDKTRTEWISGIIKDIEDDKYGLSMECIFDGFDYALAKDNEHLIIPRDESSSFLTKYLRRYKKSNSLNPAYGSGEYEGYRVGRVLKDYVFCGEGLTDDPANKKSILMPFSGEIAKASELFKGDEMEITKEMFSELQKQLASATAKITELEAGLKSVNDEKVALSTKVAELTEAKEKLEVAHSELESEKEKLFSENQSHASSIEAKDKRIAELISDVTKANRLGKLAEAGVTGDEATKLLDKWSTATDEQFDSVLELVKASVKPEVQEAVESEVTEDPKEEVAEAAVIEGSEDESQVVPEKDEKEDTIAKASAWLRDSVLNK